MAEFMRAMRAGEEAQIDALLREAFGGADEAALVSALRKSGAMAGEQVVAEGGRVVGYLALSAMVAPKGWLCLAPVAVAADRQGRGIGRRMVRFVAGWAEAAGQTLVVLGDPAFYGRCGFRAAAGLTSPYPIESTLVAGPANAPEGTALVYPKAFGAL